MDKVSKSIHTYNYTILVHFKEKKRKEKTSDLRKNKEKKAPLGKVLNPYFLQSAV